MQGLERMFCWPHVVTPPSSTQNEIVALLSRNVSSGGSSSVISNVAGVDRAIVRDKQLVGDDLPWFGSVRTGFAERQICGVVLQHLDSVVAQNRPSAIRPSPVTATSLGCRNWPAATPDLPISERNSPSLVNTWSRLVKKFKLNTCSCVSYIDTPELVNSNVCQPGQTDQVRRLVHRRRTGNFRMRRIPGRDCCGYRQHRSDHPDPPQRLSD